MPCLPTLTFRPGYDAGQPPGSRKNEEAESLIHESTNTASPNVFKKNAKQYTETLNKWPGAIGNCCPLQ